jgi:hypothetical protein
VTENSIAGQASALLPEAADNKNLTNVERLRAHLKPDSLAAMLLEAWDEGADAQQIRTKMLSALQSYSTGKGADNAPAQTE